MNFSESINYIKSLDVYGSVLGLSNMIGLAKELGNPEDSLKFIHVTGTNGKGSTCAFLSSILISAGYKVGSYNSPAVLSDVDQYRINMDIISDELYAKAVSQVKDACERIVAKGGVQPTRFEVETMAAFVAFQISQCDIVVLETGLGGRDDATNIIKTAILHIFTSISYDHEAVLGNTLKDIAENKSHIIKSSAPALMYDRSPADHDPEIYEVNEVIRNRCIEQGAKLYTVSERDVYNTRCVDGRLLFDLRRPDIKDVSIFMTGAYQPINAAIAVNAAVILEKLGYSINEDSIREGLKTARIPFRFECTSVKCENGKEVDIILDGAHNPDGAKQFMHSLDLWYRDKDCIFITGIFKDKDYNQMARITAGRASIIYSVENNNSIRALSRTKLADVLKKYNKNVLIKDTIEDAINCAIHEASVIMEEKGRKPLICCFGSLSWLNRAKTAISKIPVS